MITMSTDKMDVDWKLGNLETRIKDNSEYINSLIALIPPKHYFRNDPSNEENSDINEFWYNKRKRFSKQELKKQKKDAKKQKLDSNNLKTVLDIHKEKLLNINQKKSSISSEDESEDDKEISEGENDDNNESDTGNEEKTNQSINQAKPKVQMSTAERLAIIRQAKQTSVITESNSERKPKRPSKAEKKKKKQKSKANKQMKKEIVNSNDNRDLRDDGNSIGDGDIKIKFAKFDFEQKTKKTKKQDNIHLLNKLKKKSENFEELKQKDPEKAMVVKEGNAWGKVFRKAEGEKIKDDLKLLKRTIKKNAIKKKKSEKTWNTRIETIAKNINEKQKKRKSNIQTRIEEKRKRKIKKRK